MAIADVTFGNLSDLIKEFAPMKYTTAINLQVPLLSEGVLKKADPDDSVVLVYGLPDGLSSTTFVEDLGDLPLGIATTPFEGKATPKPIVSVIKLGRSVANAKMPDAKKATILDAHLESGARNGARQLGRGLFGGTVSPLAPTPPDTAQWTNDGDLNDTVTLDFDDVSLFRVGQAYDYVDSSGSKSYVVRCQSVTPKALTNSANVAGTVVFINDVKDSAGNQQYINSTNANGGTAITVATNDLFALRGTYTSSNFAAAYAGSATASGNALTSFDDVCGSGASGNLYGVNAANTNFKGQSVTASAAYSQELILGFLAQMELYSDMGPNQAVMSPKLAAAHAASVGHQVTFAGLTGGVGGFSQKMIESSMDKYGTKAKMTVRGLPITVDPNCQADRVIFFNDTTTKLYEWRAMGVVDEEGNGIRVLDDKYGFQIQIAGECELVAHERRDCGSILELTGL
jgi:hypothetical protein